MQLELTQDELAMVKDILETAYRDLKEEIYKTEDYNYKLLLKEREKHLESVLHKISQIETPVR